MSTDIATEAAIEAAAQLDALIPQMIHERRMGKLWNADYDRDRHIAMPLLRELGRTAPGEGWETAAGSIRIVIRRGELDWCLAHAELLDAIDSIAAAAPQHGLGWVLTALAALQSQVPQLKPDSAPYLDLREAREEPDAITRVRNAGALEALMKIGSRLPQVTREDVDELVDEYGRFEEGARS